MTKQKIITLSIIGLFTLTVVITVALSMYYLSKDYADKAKLPLSYISVVSYPNSPISSAPATDVDVIRTYTNSNLPGLQLKYRNSWLLKVKEFQHSDSLGFKSKYFPLCEKNCMGINLTKESISLNIIFDLVFDDSGKRCSNSVEYIAIDNNWIRVKDNTGYFYTRNFEQNVTTKAHEPFTLGQANDEWSLLSNQSYKLCVLGTGYLRSESSPALPEAGTLVENPTIEGNPTSEELKEVDGIIKTLN